MRIGLLTDSLSAYSLDGVLDAAEALGVADLEFCTGGWSEAPHLDVFELVSDDRLRGEFEARLADRGMRISALNANGNQLHPVTGPQVDAVVRATVELASLLEVPTVVLMSGLPGGAAGERTPNWITTSWPPETQTILDYQWNEVALPYWPSLGAAGRCGLPSRCTVSSWYTTRRRCSGCAARWATSSGRTWTRRTRCGRARTRGSWPGL